MKTILATLLLCAFPLFAESIGTFDPVARTWSVKCANFSCCFYPGQMFPSRFMLKEAGELPRSGFGDYVMDTDKKIGFSLKYDRWAESKVLINTKENFSIELTGKFCRPGVKRKEELSGVTAVYRYDFSADKPGFKISFFLQKAPQVSANLRIMKTLSPDWNEIWFDSWRELPTGTKQKLNPGRFIDRHKTKGVEFIGKKFSMQVFSRRIIAILTPQMKINSFVNAGCWTTDWKTAEFKGDAEFLFLITH